jgi:hypothetical protein
MKTYGEWRYSSTFLDLGTRWMWVVSHCRFTPGERAPDTHWIRGWVGPRVGLDAGNRTPAHPARSPSLYRLSYKSIPSRNWIIFQRRSASIRFSRITPLVGCLAVTPILNHTVRGVTNFKVAWRTRLWRWNCVGLAGCISGLRYWTICWECA